MKPLLVLNIAWMREYRGLGADQPEGKFGYMRKGGVPHEIFNFLPSHGRCYGYAAVRNSYIDIQQLGAKSGDDVVNDVLVVWTATNPQGGSYIIGWYDRATVYEFAQHRTVPVKTSGLKGPLYYNVVAPADACRLFSLDERVFRIPHGKPGFPGQSASFYPEGTMPAKWIERIRQYVSTGLIGTKTPPKKPGGGYSSDPEHRGRVEAAAIKHVVRHYKKLHYAVISCEAEKWGWDLEARQGETTLRLEVKGLSGSDVTVELTPNEYKAMRARQYRSSYRLCIVTDALAADRAKLRVFAYDADADRWLDKLEMLNIKELTGARMTV